MNKGGGYEERRRKGKGKKKSKMVGEVVDVYNNWEMDGTGHLGPGSGPDETYGVLLPWTWNTGIGWMNNYLL